MGVGVSLVPSLVPSPDWERREEKGHEALTYNPRRARSPQVPQSLSSFDTGHEECLNT